jgi:hypothetical protein
MPKKTTVDSWGILQEMSLYSGVKRAESFIKVKMGKIKLQVCKGRLRMLETSFAGVQIPLKSTT